MVGFVPFQWNHKWSSPTLCVSHVTMAESRLHQGGARESTTTLKSTHSLYHEEWLCLAATQSRALCHSNLSHSNLSFLSYARTQEH